MSNRIKFKANSDMDMDTSIPIYKEEIDSEFFEKMPDYKEVSKVIYERDEEVVLSKQQLLSYIFGILSQNPYIVREMSEGITDNIFKVIQSKLMSLHRLEVDLLEIYNSSKLMRDTLDFIATGKLVGENFENIIPSDMKLFVFTGDPKKDVRFSNLDKLDVGLYKSKIAISNLTKSSINLAGKYLGKNYLKAYNSLSLYDVMRQESKNMRVNTVREVSNISLLDNMELARLYKANKIDKNDMKSLSQERMTKIKTLATFL
ncbi:hypothetical protein ThvES_00020040 [Thiovulum sp. ES]|nr:hypothetical protein ThvES_00020040 [Thiovulum sp. ES]